MKALRLVLACTLLALLGCKLTQAPPPPPAQPDVVIPNGGKLGSGTYTPRQLLPQVPGIPGQILNLGTDLYGHWVDASAGSGGTALPDAGTGGIWTQNIDGGVDPVPGAIAGQLLQTGGPGGLPTWVNVVAGDIGPVIAPPVAASWSTHVNFGAGSNTTIIDTGPAQSPAVYLSDFLSGGGEVVRCVFVNRPGSVGTPYTLTAAIHVVLFPTNNAAAGIAVTNGTQIISYQLVFVSGGVDIQVVNYNSATSFNANAYSAGWNIGQNGRFWLRVQVDASFRTFSYSSDGRNFIPGASFFQSVNTSFINNNETQAGLCVSPIGSTGAGVTDESWSFTAP